MAWTSHSSDVRMWCVTDVEKDLSLRMSDTVEKIKQLMLDQRTARTCKSLTELSDTLPDPVILCTVRAFNVVFT